ncbi:translocation/assembly module TamB domain-containing protein [Thalassospira profundimaris]|uniref:translocation/assembly module TamB domain-containing protein n=1 Tax=Thalassospira profundimaris TaxID=502049 RepID=UPI000DEDD730|nr:translocation/assembly module TamB domain-containing protein [Thalassospira profundimaris]
MAETHKTDKTAQQAKTPRKRGVLGWLKRAVLGFVALLVMLVLLVFIAGTGPVLRSLTPWINRTVSDAINGQFALGRVEGSLWNSLSVSSLNLDMPDTGLKVDGDDLILAWSPLALLGAKVEIERVGASALNITLPNASSSSPDDQTEESGGFTLPVSFALETLDVPKIHITHPADGRVFSYQLSGYARASQNLSAVLALNLQPLDGGADYIRADLDFDAEGQKLKADIEGHLDRKGLGMALAGLTETEAPDVTLSLKGSGPANDWTGDLQFTATSLACVNGTVKVQMGDEKHIGFGLDVVAQSLGDLANSLPPALRGDVALKTDGVFDGKNSLLDIASLNVSKDRLLTASGTAKINFADNSLDANLSSDIDGTASALLDNAVRWQKLNLNARAKGDLALPAIDADISASGIETPVSTIGTLTATANLVPDGDDFALKADLHTLGHEFRDAALGEMAGKKQDISLTADATGDFSEITVKDLNLQTPKINARATAVLDDTGAVKDASLTADVSDLSAFAAISGMDLTGQGRVDISGLRWNITQGGQAKVNITTQQAGFGIAELDHVVGDSPVIKANLAISPVLDLAVDVNTIQAANIAGAGKVNITDDFNTLLVTADLGLKAGIIPPSIPVSLKGKDVKLTVALNGPMAAPEGKITLAAPIVETSDQVFSDVKLATNMVWQPVKGDGGKILQLRNRGGFSWQNAPYKINADLALPSDGLTVSNIALTGDHIDLAGHLAMPGYAVPLKGDIALNKLDAVMTQAFGVPLANGRITADVTLSPKNAAQHIALEARAKGLRMVGPDGIETARLEDVRLEGRIDNAFTDPDLNLTLEGRDIGSNAGRVETLKATLAGVLKKLDVDVKARAMVQNRIPVKLDTRAEIAIANDIALTASKLDADVGTQHISLRAPLEFRRSANGRMASNADIAIGNGALGAKLDLVPGKRFVATVDVADIALGPWGAMFDISGLDGKLTLKATAEETPKKPATARIDGTISNISVAAASQLPPLTLELKADLQDGNVNADLEMGRPDLKVLTARGTVPVDVSFLKSRFAARENEPISAQAKIDGDIGQFWPYVPLPDHSLSGNLKLDASVDGTLATPLWQGTVALRDGRYEHLQYGTLVQDIVLDGDFNNDGFQLTRLTADDGGQGSLTGKADVKLGAGVDYTANIKMRNMAVTRMDELRVWTDVDVDVTGDEKKADIESTVTLRRGEVDLSVALPASVPELNVQNLAKTQDGEKKKDAKKNSGGFVATLNAKVDVPGRLFVRGKGLDSEWGGHLDITGRADNPKIVGELRALRGQLDLIGKTFVIKDSKITFSGAQPPDPLLNIVGVYTTDDLTVTASLSGPATDPKLSLTSQPALPQDEILSQVLFGKSQGSLSAVEAVQLANAAAQLSGSGGGLDVIGTIRNFIGADVLSVDGGENGPTVKAGKYLTDDIYVGTKQGTTPGSSGVEVEIELTPHIKITSETSEIDSKAGIQFKLDY